MPSSPVSLPYFDSLLASLPHSPEVVQAFGRHVHWGYWANPDQAQNTGADFAAAAEALAQMVYGAAQIQEGDRLLDVGCGFGGTIASLNEQFQRLDLTGLNIDARQLERARQLVTPQAHNQITFVEGNACELPFEDASFDRLLAVECIFHFPDRRQFFQEAFRVLKPGGHLALSDFVPVPLLMPGIALQQTLSSWCSSQPGFYGSVQTPITLADYRHLAQSVGFESTVEQDITQNTIPTYFYLWHLNRQIPQSQRQSDGATDWSAITQTTLLAFSSYLNLLQYLVLGFAKP
ncbi:MAG: methyltransferase domain-containing protein [Prochlorothrix sp.]|nr:methyltransferase domain-containing protein [Prochlorothrix sp.]